MMHLLALNNEENKAMKYWLHYLIRKMELQEAQGEECWKRELPILKKIQEQVLKPKPVGIRMIGNTVPNAIHVDDKIIIDI